VTTTLDQLLSGATRDGDAWQHHVGPDWMQGRTAYGGISAALALDAALRDHPGAAPLRTAQISFVGPVGGETRTTTRLLRQSKSSRFVSADLFSEAGYGTNAVFTHMPGRSSHLDHQKIVAPDVPDADALASVPNHPVRPEFTKKFDMRPVGGPTFKHGQDIAEITTWVRWIDEPACDPHIALLALADALPPAALVLFREFGPLSSSTWMQHFLTDHPRSPDGWWLLVSRSGQAQRGFSAQVMEIWNSERDLVSVGGQGVAIYV
jgi:acyl-CoA thioesterase